MFPVNYIQQFELNQQNRPTKKLVVPTHNFLVNSLTGEKEPVSYSNILVKDNYFANKQTYLMQIFQIEKDINIAKQIYNEWDWMEFIIYKQCMISTRALEV